MPNQSLIPDPTLKVLVAHCQRLNLSDAQTCAVLNWANEAYLHIEMIGLLEKDFLKLAGVTADGPAFTITERAQEYTATHLHFPA